MKKRHRIVVTELGMPSDAVPDDISAQCDLVFGPVSAKLDEQSLAELAMGADAILFSSRDPITRTVLNTATTLKLAAKFGARPTNIDFEAAAERGIAVGWTPGANARAVAEFTVFLTLAGLRRVDKALESLAAGGWRSPDHIGLEIENRTVGLIGFGAIGRIVTRLFRAMDAKVVVHDPYVNKSDVEEAGAKIVSLEVLLQVSDVVSLHCQLGPETHRLLRAETLALMKPTAVLVNTARGELIDETAVVKALEGGRLGAAGLDVFCEEPLPLNHPLRQTKGVIATPHVAARSLEAIQRERFWALRGAIAFLEGRPAEHMQFLAPTRAQ